MATRRDFLQATAAAVTGLVFTDCGLRLTPCLLLFRGLRNCGLAPGLFGLPFPLQRSLSPCLLLGGLLPLNRHPALVGFAPLLILGLTTLVRARELLINIGLASGFDELDVNRLIFSLQVWVIVFIIMSMAVMVALGVSFGAHIPNQIEERNPGSPLSSSVGSSGAEAKRFLAVTP